MRCPLSKGNACLCRGSQARTAYVPCAHALLPPAARPVPGSCWSRALETAAAPSTGDHRADRLHRDNHVTLWHTLQAPTSLVLCLGDCRPRPETGARTCLSMAPCQRDACLPAIMSTAAADGESTARVPGPRSAAALHLSCVHPHPTPSPHPTVALVQQVLQADWFKGPGAPGGPRQPLKSLAPGEVEGCNCVCSPKQKGLQGYTVRAIVGAWAGSMRWFLAPEHAWAGQRAGRLPWQATVAVIRAEPAFLPGVLPGVHRAVRVSWRVPPRTCTHHVQAQRPAAQRAAQPAGHRGQEAKQQGACSSRIAVLSGSGLRVDCQAGASIAQLMRILYTSALASALPVPTTCFLIASAPRVRCHCYNSSKRMHQGGRTEGWVHISRPEVMVGKHDKAQGTVKRDTKQEQREIQRSGSRERAQAQAAGKPMHSSSRCAPLSTERSRSRRGRAPGRARRRTRGTRTQT